MSDSQAAPQVLDALLSGMTTEEIDIRLRALNSVERQAVLCTVCYLLDEVKVNCLERGEEIATVLTRHCPRYRSGERCGDLGVKVEMGDRLFLAR